MLYKTNLNNHIIILDHLDNLKDIQFMQFVINNQIYKID